MFNHETDKSVACDNCCDDKQDHHYCMFVFLHITLILCFRMQPHSYQAAVLRVLASDYSYLALL